MTVDAHQTLEASPEYALLAAILHQARVDLRETAPSYEQASSIRFFTNEARHFEMLCGLLDLDYESIQQAVMRQFPEQFAHAA
jgi:hypothetical protein